MHLPHEVIAVVQHDACTKPLKAVICMALPWRLPKSSMIGIFLVVTAMLATTVLEASTRDPSERSAEQCRHSNPYG